MNSKKFCSTISAIISVFLFITGAAILIHIDSLNASAEGVFNDSSSLSHDLFKPFLSDQGPVNFLVLIGDKNEANTDTILLVNFNPVTDRLNIMSIPRDTKIDLGLKIPKINSVYARKNGRQLLIDTVNSTFGVKVDYFIYFNIAVFRNIIDQLGGVYIDVPVDMDYDDPYQDLHIHLKKGRQLLDGKKAEQFLRFRHPNEGGFTKEVMQYYDGSDIKRIEAQQYFIRELIKQKANFLYISKLKGIIDTVYENVETNMTLNDIARLARNVTDFTDFSLDQVGMFTVPGESRKEDGIWYYIIDREETLKITRQHFSGGNR